MPEGVFGRVYSRRPYGTVGLVVDGLGYATGLVVSKVEAFVAITLAPGISDFDIALRFGPGAGRSGSATI